MPCNTNITQSLSNSCHPVKGVEPIIYWDYRSNLSFTFVNNTITAITAFPLGRIEVKKFGVNAGHVVVVLENQVDRYKHKVDTVINENLDIIDDIDDIVCFVKENGATDWKVYGAKYGLWKESQTQMFNDNLATIALSLASREGMEEEYEAYNTTIDIAALPNMADFDLLYGGQIANGGEYKLTIDPSKTGYINLPNGQKITTTGGAVSDTYVGMTGSISFYTPKDSTGLDISDSDISGAIIYNNGKPLYAGSNVLITKITANGTSLINCNGNTIQTELEVLSALDISAQSCALTAQSIGDCLINIHDNLGSETGTANFSGGTNALKTDIEAYIIAQGYALPGDDVIDWFGNDCPDWTLTLRTP